MIQINRVYKPSTPLIHLLFKEKVMQPTTTLMTVLQTKAALAKTRPIHSLGPSGLAVKVILFTFAMKT